MESVILSVPILPRKTEAVRKMYQTVREKRWTEYLVAQKKCGVEKERDFLQTTPKGDVVLICMESKDIRRVFTVFAASKDPVDVWIKSEFEKCTGVDLNQSDDGPLPELLLSYDK